MYIVRIFIGEEPFGLDMLIDNTIYYIFEDGLFGYGVIKQKCCDYRKFPCKNNSMYETSW